MGIVMKVRIILASMMINFVQCINLYFGNLLPYIHSVYYNWPQKPQHDVDSSWMFNTYLIFYVAGTLSVDVVRVRIGLPSTAIVGILIYDVGLLLTYFTVRHSVWACTSTFMVMGGLGTAYLEAALFLYMAGWFPRKLGIATSLALTSNSIGGVVINYVVTAYINPDGLAPDSKRESVLFFSQTVVVARVPEIFLVIGTLAVVLHAVGFSLIKAPSGEGVKCCLSQENRVKDTKENNFSVDETQSHTSYHDNFSGDESRGILANTTHLQILANDSENAESSNTTLTSIQRSKDKRQPAEKSHRYSCTTSRLHHEDKTSRKPDEEHRYIKGQTYTQEIDNHPNEDANEKSGDAPISKICDTKTNENHSDKTPIEVLKMEMFYYVNLSVFAEALANIVVASYYKMFGLLWIPDDYFFALLGSSASFLNIGFQLGIGYLVDILGVQKVLIAHLAINSIFLCFWPFTAVRNRWLYFVFSNVLLCLLASQYYLFPLVAIKLFGTTFFPSNLGLILTSSLVGYFISSPLVTFLLGRLGWNWMFIIIGAFSIIPLVLISTRNSEWQEISRAS